jgi:hypothetical protein
MLSGVRVDLSDLTAQPSVQNLEPPKFLDPDASWMQEVIRFQRILWPPIYYRVPVEV